MNSSLNKSKKGKAYGFAKKIIITRSTKNKMSKMVDGGNNIY